MLEVDGAPWYRRTLVGMEVGPTGAEGGIDPADSDYACRLSGEEIVAQQLRIRSEYLVIWARDNEFAYYDSRIALKAPGLGPRDLVRECMDAAQGSGLPVIAYCRIQHEGYTWRLHPEWRMVGADGKEKRNHICLNSGYRDYIRQLITELAAYAVQGFHFDMLDLGFGAPHGCYCSANCRPLYQATYGSAMPTEATWDADWERLLEFRYDSVQRFEDDIRAFVAGISPGLTVDFNYHGYPPHSWEVGQRPVQHARPSDFVSAEAGTRALGALETGLVAEYMAGAKPGGTYQGALVQGVRTYHDQTVRPTNDFKWEVFTYLAHGACVTVVDKTAYDGRLNPVFYDRLQQVFAEVHRKREHFGQRPVRDVGLFYSQRTRDWYGREAPCRYHGAFFGAHAALVQEHISFGVVFDEALSTEVLARFPVVYVPNAAVLSEVEVQRFGEYVAGGGKLLLTGLTGRYDPRGNERQDGALEELVGVHFAGWLAGFDNWASLPHQDTVDEALGNDIPTAYPFLVYGPAAHYMPTDATARGDLLLPQRTLRQRNGTERVSLPMSPDERVGPLLFERDYGQGKLILVPCSPDAALASDYPVTEARLFIRNLVRYLQPQPSVQITAPAYVESVITRDDDHGVVRIHLIGYVTPGGCTGPKAPLQVPRMMEGTPLYRVTIRLNRSYRTVQALNPTTQLTVNGSTIEALIEDVHETVVLSD